ncbi:cytochrome b/b6 domain-containing protein [Thermanaerothrix daxensis]|uniref:cytochrome b/b6 domain-containing protein n=1 Tax=Thermanaerothrix daxensis TaxID=869279 RepID=UPI0006C92A12|nr:cytochrome b/b6 domain-containing protein [Thermanaerothrix daxensis]
MDTTTATPTHKVYLRFDILQRIEHWLLVASFTTLAVTGLVQKFALFPLSPVIVRLLGGIEMVRILHRIAATVFMVEAIYHLVSIGYKLYVEKKSASMLPGFKDLQDAFQTLAFNLGLAKERPKMGRYNFVEKAEYWALVWGLVIMALTGFMLWNPIATTRLLPGEVVPAAKAAHGAEAVLAVLAIMLWHFYHVHIRHWNASMFTGYLTREEMEEEHALELEMLEQGQVEPEISPEERKRRLRVFIPVASVLSLALLYGVFRFVTFEETAITTLPPAEREVAAFVRRTPTPIPSPTVTPTMQATQPAAAGSLTWDGGVADIFARRCSACHGQAGGFSVADYRSIMKGGKSGTVIVPGDPDRSRLIQVVGEGKHPGAFTEIELTVIREWIAAGALER